jgi:hypothetical protein
MTKAQSLKVIGFFVFAILAFQQAIAADLSLNTKGRIPAPNKWPDMSKSTPDQKAIVNALKNFTLDPALYKKFKNDPNLKAKMGGVDTGGGQGVYDMRTGRVRFVDILSKEELQQMQLAKNPAEQVFARFPKCTKIISQSLPYKYWYDFQNAANLIFNALDPSLGIFKYMTQTGNGELAENMTALKLRQLKDATTVAPDYQIQLATYRDGVSYIQQQALALMPYDDFKWLVVKEDLRVIAALHRVKVSNREVEEVLRLIYSGNSAAIAETTYYLKMIRPMFKIDAYEALLGKKELIEKRLEKADLSLEEREIWESDLADIKLKESVDFTEYHYKLPERLKLELDNRGYIVEDFEVNRNTSVGIPGWALSFAIGENVENLEAMKYYEAPTFKGFDVETGHFVSNFGKCSKVLNTFEEYE